MDTTAYVVLNSLIANKEIIRGEDGKLRLKTSMGCFQSASLRALATIMEDSDRVFTTMNSPPKETTPNQPTT